MFAESEDNHDTERRREDGCWWGIESRKSKVERWLLVERAASGLVAQGTRRRRPVKWTGCQVYGYDPRMSADWVGWVNQPRTDAEPGSLRMGIAKGRPFGQYDWRRLMIQQLGLEPTARRPGRPRRRKAE